MENSHSFFFQIAQVEKKLKSLKDDKHEMFLYLKRVLYEDKRRTIEDKEARYAHLNYKK